MNKIIDIGPAPLVVSIEKDTIENTNYRTTLWTGANLQVTLMSIEPGSDIGLEVHEMNDQFLRIEQGMATVSMGPNEEHLQVWSASANDAVIVPAGTWHNLASVGDVPLKVYSIYAPVKHPHGTVHVTKDESEMIEAIK